MHKNNEFYVCPHYCERQRDYWVILFHRKILMTSCGVCMMQGWTHVIWYLSRKCSVIFLHCFWVAIPFIWGLLAIVVQFSWYSFMQVFQHYSKTLEHQCCSFLSPVSTPAYGYFPKYSLVWLKPYIPVHGMLAVMIFLSGLLLMTISMSQHSHRNVLINLAMVAKSSSCIFCWGRHWWLFRIRLMRKSTGCFLYCYFSWLDTVWSGIPMFWNEKTDLKLPVVCKFLHPISPQTMFSCNVMNGFLEQERN